jgi:hypothetical protein
LEHCTRQHAQMQRTQCIQRRMHPAHVMVVLDTYASSSSADANAE